MKNKMIAAAMLLAGFGTNAIAQSTDYGTATAVLVIPISIAKTADMHFGTLAASATAGTAVLSYANTTVATGGVSKPAGGIVPTTASFTVTGQATSGFSIAFPASITLTSGANTMLVNIVSESATASTLVAGSKILKFGGTLNVAANQPAGTYLNDEVDATGLYVTVNYN
jgi:hypothetical protein